MRNNVYFTGADLFKMTDLEIKERILKVFHLARQKPDSEFDETHFLDYLTYPPHRKNLIKGTFRGSRKYYRFMDGIELEFGICFPLSDLDNYYSIDSLTKKVIERINKKRGNVMVLKERLKTKDRYLFESILLILLALLYITLGVHWLSLTMTFIFSAVIYWTISSKVYDRQHNKKLSSIILV